LLCSLDLKSQILQIMSMLTKIMKRMRNAIPSIVFRFVLPSFISLLLEDGIVYFMTVKMMIFWYT
jgi:hypothetical protein